MSVYLTLFLLFLLQFVYLPFGISFFEGSKVIVFEAATLILLTIRLFSKTGMRPGQYKMSFFVVLFLIFAIAGIDLVHYSTQTVFFGNAFRLQGTLLLMTLIFFALSTAHVSIEKKYLPRLALFVLAAQVVFAITLIGVGTDRPVGTIGEPNALAASVLFFWPFLYFVTPSTLNPNWWMRAIGLLLVCVVVIIAGSRSGVIALAIQLAFLLFNSFFKRKAWLAIGAAVILLFASYILPLLSKGDLYENRGEIWQSAIVAGSERGLWGVGFGNSEYVLHNANVKLNNHLPGYYVDSAHNIFLDWFVQAGLVGLALFCFLLVGTFAQLHKEKNTRNIVLLLGIIASLSFNPASVVSLVALWWIIGQACHRG